MSHVYYFGNESLKPLGNIEFSSNDLQITRIGLSDEETNIVQHHKNEAQDGKKKSYDRKFTSAYAARETVYIIDEKGELWTFGVGSKGQLGIGESVHKIHKATNIHKTYSMIKEKVTNLAVGFNHVLCLTDKKTLFGWGEASYGKLLDLDSSQVLKPKIIEQNIFQEDPVNTSHTLNEKSELFGEIYAKKRLSKEQLGVNKPRGSSTSVIRELKRENTGDYFNDFKGNTKGNNQQAAPPGSLLMRKSSSQVSYSQMPQIKGSSGSVSNLQQSILPRVSESQELPKHPKDEDKQTNNNNNRPSIMLPQIPQKIGDNKINFPANKRATRILSKAIISVTSRVDADDTLMSVGMQHSLVFQKGVLYSFGKSENGILGCPNFQGEYTKVPMVVMSQIKLAGIATGSFHSVAWDVNGVVYSWGEGTHGQLGHPIEKGYNFNKIETHPKIIKMLKGKNIIQAACGKFYSAAITIEGELYAWGKGEYSKEAAQQSTISLMESLYPKRLMPEGNNAIHVKFIKVACGASHNATIDQFGRLYTWGDSQEFCLGHDQKQDLQQPKLVKLLREKITMDVACGDRFTVVIQEEVNSGRKANIVDQFKSRNISNIRQKIKTIFDYSKLRAQVVNDGDEKSQKNEGEEDPNNVHEISLSLSHIASETPRLQKRQSERKSPIKQIKNKQPIDSPIAAASPSTKKHQFELNLEELLGQKKNGSTGSNFEGLARQFEGEFQGDNHNQSIIDSKDSQANIVLNNLRSVMEKDYQSTKTFKAVQDASFNDVPDVIKRHNKNIKDSQIKMVHHGNSNSDSFALVFDECSEQLVHKEKTDPLYLPFYAGPLQANLDDSDFLDEADEETLTEPARDSSKQKAAGKYKILQQNSQLQGFLGNLLESRNELLKYEYIEMVRRGMEDEHLLYLLSDPQEGNITKKAKDHLKAKLNKKILENADMNHHAYNDTKEVMEKQKKNMSELYSKCKGAQMKAQKAVGKFNRFPGTDPRVLKPLKRYLPLLNSLNSSAVYSQYLETKLRDNSILTSERIAHAQEKREEIYNNKRMELIQKLEEKSSEYQREIALRKQMKFKETERKKQVILALTVEQMICFFRRAVNAGLKKRQDMFVYNLKARIIQNNYKRHLVLKKMKTFNVVQIHLFRAFVQKWQKQKATKKIALYVIKQKLYQKIKTNLVKMRHTVLNIQKFFFYFMGIQFGQLSLMAAQFDNHMLNTAKTVDAQFLRYYKKQELAQNGISQQQSPEKGKSMDFENTPSASNVGGTTRNRGNNPPDNLRPPKQLTSCIANGVFVEKIIIGQNLKLLPSFVFNDNQVDLKEKLPLEKRGNQKTSKTGVLKVNHMSSVMNAGLHMDAQPQGTLLPFTQHKDFLVLPTNYKVSYENQSVHEQIYEKVEKAELRIKYEILRDYLHRIRRKYRDSLREYQKQLSQFCQEFKHEVDLERTKLLLRTAPTNLKIIEKKEEYEFKRAKKKTTVQSYSVKDHLPFGTIILNIAAQMPKAPGKPVLKIKINSETFKSQLDEYYKQFKNTYAKYSYEQRIQAMNAQKAKKLGGNNSGSVSSLAGQQTSQQFGSQKAL